MAEEITRDSITSINIEKLALNKDFGRLVFKNSLPYLKKTQNLFKEFDELNYQDDLSQEEINSIDNKKDQFVQQLTQLQQFDIGQANSQQAHDNLEQQFINFYNSISRELRMQLVYLRQEAARKSQDVVNLEEQQKAAVQAEQKYKELAKKLEVRFQEFDQKEKELEAKKKEVETAHGEVATKVLAYHFAKQANDYTIRAGDMFYSNEESQSTENWFNKTLKWIKKPRSWRTIRSIFWWTLLIILIFNFALYFLIFFLHKSGKIGLATDDIFTLEYGIIKLALISLLYYGMHFASRNYNIVSNLEAVNRHRKNVAQTLEDFLATNPDEGVRSEMIRQGTDAMFRHLPTGYIRKSGRDEDGGSIIKSFTNILKQDK